jgi:hypothetical protein
VLIVAEYMEAGTSWAFHVALVALLGAGTRRPECCFKLVAG